jgi:hypothetical protein
MRAHAAARSVASRPGITAAGALVALAIVASSDPARAYYEESRITSDEVRITVEASGLARVEHKLVWRVVAGQPKGFDLPGVEPLATPDPTTSLESDDGHTAQASVTLVPGKGLRVALAEPKAVHHGQQYRLNVAYGVDLVGARELVRDGSRYRLEWHAPPPADGLEGPKVTFVLPAALEAPGALIGEGGMRDDGVTATLKRAPDHDEIELVRPHVGRGEDLVWAVRADARAFDGGHGPAVAPPPPPPRRDEPGGAGLLVHAVVGLLAFAFAALVRARDARFRAAWSRTALAGSPPPRGLFPLRPYERAAAAGAAFFVGLSLQLADLPAMGVAAIALAMVTAVLRAPEASLPARGPGRWLVLRPEEAFARPRRPSFFVPVVLAFASAALAGAAYVLRGSHPEAPVVLALDALCLVPVVVTGRPSQVLPEPVASSGAWLGRLFGRLRGVRGLRVSPWGRVPNGRARPDELRLLVLPREAMPGLAGIEVGLGWGRAATSFVAAPEVLVRVHEATAASARMISLAPGIVPVTGRKPEERVYRLSPRVPTRRATRALVEALGVRLVDRRVHDADWAREERRIPPATRAAAVSNEAAPVIG